MTNNFLFISAGLYLLVQFAAVLWAVRLDPRFGLHPVPINAKDLRWTRGIFGWNIAVVVAFLLYLRFSTIAANMFYGEGATLILGLVFLLIGYQRQISMGLVIGLDAIVARLFGGDTEHREKSEEARIMTLQTTYIQGIFSFASVTALWVLAEPVFRYWLGNTLNDSGWAPETAAMLFRIMSVGVLARSLSESWMKILGGHGLVGAYAPWLLTGGVIFASLLVAWLMWGTPLEILLTRVAISFAALYAIVHAVIIPEMLCRSLELSRWKLAHETLLPGLVIVPGTIVLELLAGPWFGAGYTVLAATFLLAKRLLAPVRGPF